MRWFVAMAIVFALIGCGGGSASGPGPPPAPDLGLPRADKARTCLSKAGFHVVGGPRSPSDRNAPEVELVLNGPGADAFLGFYKRAERARRYESQLGRNARRFNGSVERRGRVSIVWVHKPRVEAGRVEACVF